MLYSQKQLDDLLMQFSTMLQKNISVKEMYLFGSYITGKLHSNSDIDIAVISDEFRGQRFFDRKKLNDIIISKTYPKLDFIDIEVHPFKSENFNESDPLAEEVLKTGKRIL